MHAVQSKKSIVLAMHFYRYFSILFVDLVSDDILQMVLGSELLKKFGGSLGEEYYITLINAICCTFKQLAAMPLSTKRIQIHCSQIQRKDTKNVSRYISGQYSIRHSHTLISLQSSQLWLRLGKPWGLPGMMAVTHSPFHFMPQWHLIPEQGVWNQEAGNKVPNWFLH